MADITVTEGPRDGERMTFAVVVGDAGGQSRHGVTVTRADFERLSRPDEGPDSFIRRCFEFLLEREPKEAILGSFDISVISQYFPDFETEISR